MQSGRKATKEHKKAYRKKSNKKSSNVEDLEIVWEQVFPEDAEIRIQRAFEMLLSDDFDPPSKANAPLKPSVDNSSKGDYADSKDKH